MSCPHPSAPVERLVGSFSEMVCRDCHAHLEAPAVVVDDVEALIAVLDAPKPSKRGKKSA